MLGKDFQSFKFESKLDALISKLKKICELKEQNQNIMLWGKDGELVSDIVNACLLHTRDVGRFFLHITKVIPNFNLEGADKVEIIIVSDLAQVLYSSEQEQKFLELIESNWANVIVGYPGSLGSIEIASAELNTRLKQFTHISVD